MAEYTEQDGSVNFNELEHADDWPDATTREPELEPDASGLEYLAQLEARLDDVYEKNKDEIEKGVETN